MEDIRKSDDNLHEEHHHQEPVQHTTMSTSSHIYSAYKRISWGAVFAGLFVAILSMILLNMLGIGIGAGAIDPLQESNPMSGIGTGAGIWWMASLIISIFAGGWVAGRMSGMPRTPDGVLHGLVTYAVFTVFMFYVVTSAAGSIISGAGTVLGKTVSLAGQGLGGVAGIAGEQLSKSGIDLNDIKNEAYTILSQTGKPELQRGNLNRQAAQAGNNAQNTMGNIAENPQNAGSEIDKLIDNLYGRANNVASSVDREAAVNVIMRRTGKSRAEANQIVDNWTNTYYQAKAKYEQLKVDAERQARVAGDKAAHAVSTAALWIFFGLVLGGVSAGVGGRLGEPKPVVISTKRTTVAAEKHDEPVRNR